MKPIICGLLLVLAGCGSGIVPGNFEVPVQLETEHFRIRPLLVSDAEKDYEAVMESIEVIHIALLSDAWPTPFFTLEENRRDLERHQLDYDDRKSFAYTVVSLDESKILGCVYINPGIGGPDAAVFMWVRKSAHRLGLDPILEQTVRKWIEDEWPFKRVVYPGRGPKGN